MTDIKFNIDPSELPDERINKHKDFKKLMYNYQLATKPLHKTPMHRFKYRRVFIILLLILLVMFIIIEFGEKEKEQETPPSKEQVTE
ncbi:MAG: hypothetical protein WAQ28_16685 [Bacteroidia bacterium]